MPNPDFEGTVPSRRCETCKWWDWLPKSAFGLCRNYEHRMPASQTAAIQHPVTTDLTVCSNWERREEK